MYAVINEMDRKLERPVRDLDDVRMVMDTLKKIREQEVDMELKIDPIEVYLCLFFCRFLRIQILSDLLVTVLMAGFKFLAQVLSEVSYPS